jgi:hypothetical protein
MFAGDVSVIAARRLRAPPGDRLVLAEPPLNEVGRLLSANRQRLAHASGTLLGRPFADLRRQAWQTAVAAARDYLRQAGEPLPALQNAPLLMAGHQPELFHPGVWVKNFAMNGLARAHGAMPLNLVVDNDASKITALRVPPLHLLTETPRHAIGPNRIVHPTLVPFDRWESEVPYEERPVQDEALFADFPDRVAQVLAGGDLHPLLPAFWREVREQAQRTPLLGERFAAARRALERAWGCHNLEVPVSFVCRTEPFAWFVCHLLTHLARFHEVHNTCLREYRRLYGIRSRAHPVPDLAAGNGWLEMPLWAWRPDRPKRGRLLARPGPTAVELRVEDQSWPSLPLAQPGDPASAVAAWLDLERGGFKVRSRALTNTLYARLFLGELFIHGIGGAKYDELTDEIVRRFYGFEPPGFLVLSATLLLPLPRLRSSPAESESLSRLLRDVHCNPQRHLNGGVADPRAVALADQKREWIGRQPQRGRERRQRYQVLQRLTAELRPYLAEREQRIHAELVRCESQLQLDTVLHRRDYAFCLFPERLLRPFCTQFLNPP